MKLNITVEICPDCQREVREEEVVVITGDHAGRYHICHPTDVSTVPIEDTEFAITEMHLTRLSD